jgi:hypothetical protein
MPTYLLKRLCSSFSLPFSFVFFSLFYPFGHARPHYICQKRNQTTQINRAANHSKNPEKQPFRPSLFLLTKTSVQNMPQLCPAKKHNKLFFLIFFYDMIANVLKRKREK